MRFFPATIMVSMMVQVLACSGADGAADPDSNGSGGQAGMGGSGGTSDQAGAAVPGAERVRPAPRGVQAKGARVRWAAREDRRGRAVVPGPEAPLLRAV